MLADAQTCAGCSYVTPAGDDGCDRRATWLDGERGLPWCDNHGPHTDDPYEWWED